MQTKIYHSLPNDDGGACRCNVVEIRIGQDWNPKVVFETSSQGKLSLSNKKYVFLNIPLAFAYILMKLSFMFVYEVTH